MDSATLPEPLLQCPVATIKGKALLDRATILPLSRFEAKPEKIKRFLLEPGRNVSASIQPILQAILTGPLQRLTIQDRYVAANDSNLEVLKQFLGAFSKVAGELQQPAPDQIRILAGPVSGQSSSHARVEWRARLKNLESWFKKDEFWRKTECVAQIREVAGGAARDYHDRVISGELKPKDKAAAEKVGRIVVEMTGGIDILMDNRETTRVYVSGGPSS
jgi:hypothetical protein